MFKNLFSPIKLGSIEVKNRIVLAPMGIGSYNNDETITDDYISFIGGRAKETGLIITTGTRASSKYGKYKLNGAYDDLFIPGLSKLAKAAQGGGAKIFLQIGTLGREDPFDPYVPSLNIPIYQEQWEGDKKPKELENSQIKEIIEEFVHAARRAKEAGFDGVELFGSEDALISSFICPGLNKREDEYGGSFENMMRLPIDIIHGIEKACGKDFPIGFKFNAVHDIDDGIDLNLGVKIAKRISQEKVAYIHEFSFKSYDFPMSTFKYPPMPNLYQPRNTTIDISEKIKSNVSGTPVIAVGGILKPDEADKIIGDKKADMVAVGRAFIAENLWAYNASRVKRIRPCIRCHVCHNEVAMHEKLIVCSVNPDVLAKDKIKKTESPKEVMIVGGGPGGITAAITASRRGHNVSLYEKDSYLGGKLIPGSVPDFKYEFLDLLNFFKAEIEESNVGIITNKEVTPDFINRNQPDVLIVAVGAEPIIPNVAGADNENVIFATYALDNADSYKSKRIVVIGGGDVGCETALLLRRNGNEVAVIEMLDELMKEEEIKHNTVILEKMLIDEGVEIYTNSNATEITSSNVKIKNSKDNIVEIPTDIIVVSVGFQSQPENVKVLLASCKNSYALGDCIEPGRLKQAISDGYRIGKMI
ncbi:MAG: FAD-dependent oxidoreductase [Actinobacteria bacterium]|nr:FAD-dependent oxidoreductase [Actinomycetota bacterium]